MVDDRWAAPGLFCSGGNDEGWPEVVDWLFDDDDWAVVWMVEEPTSARKG